MKTLLLFCLLLPLQAAFSQVTADSRDLHRVDRNVFGVGVAAGTASGFGLSFRHHLPGDVSYQLIGGIIKLGDRLHYNLGSELQFDFARGEAARFFAAGASGYFYSGSDADNSLAAPFRAGLGVGGEWSNAGAFNVAGEVLFTYFSDGTVLPLPQLGVHYYFY